MINIREQYLRQLLELGGYSNRRAKAISKNRSIEDFIYIAKKFLEEKNMSDGVSIVKNCETKNGIKIYGRHAILTSLQRTPLIIEVRQIVGGEICKSKDSRLSSSERVYTQLYLSSGQSICCKEPLDDIIGLQYEK